MKLSSTPESQFRLYIVFILALLFVLKWGYIRTLDNKVDPNGDYLTEPSHLKSGRGFLELGMTSNCGLPNFTYEGPGSDPIIYTHYPPGTDWSVATMMRFCGSAKINCLRLFPLLFTIFGLGFFFLSLPLCLSLRKSAFLATLVLALPMTGFYSSSLAYWTYPYVLLLVQWGLLIRNFKGSRRWFWPLYVLVAFVQGWFSFDFAFVSVFLPVPVVMQLTGSTSVKRWLPIVFVGGIMFTLAHLLHFLQVVCFYNGIDGALNDYRKIAELRRSGKGAEVPWIKPEQLTYLNTLRLQLDVFISKTTNFGHPAQIFFWLVTFFCLLNFKIQKTWRSYEIQLIFSRSSALVIVFGFAIASLWCLFMTQHAYVHMATARHFVVPYLLAWMVLLQGLKVTRLTRQQPEA